jgi:hypothetical protein
MFNLKKQKNKKGNQTKQKRNRKNNNGRRNLKTHPKVLVGPAHFTLLAKKGYPSSGNGRFGRQIGFARIYLCALRITVFLFLLFV